MRTEPGGTVHYVAMRSRFLPGDVGSAYPSFASAWRHTPTPVSSAVPRRRRRLWRTLLLLLRASLVAAALSVPICIGSWVWHAAGTTERVEQFARDGVPAVANPITSLRAAMLGPPTVALQIGHLDADRHPDELAVLRFSTGARAGGVDEVEVNRAVALALAERLQAAGIHVDLLAATVPPGYRADLVLALHADGNDDPARRGYKSAHIEPQRQRRDPWLQTAINVAYGAASPLPHDPENVTLNMTAYYAFSHDRFEHAVHPSTAGIVVEMGYLTNLTDRAWLVQPTGPADALYEGITRYLAAIDRWHPSLASFTEDARIDASAAQR